MLSRYMPLCKLLIVRFDNERKSMETVAVGARRRFDPQSMTSAVLAAPKWKRLQAWARGGLIARFHRADPQLSNIKRPEPEDDLFTDLVPLDLLGDMLIGPLENTEGPAGLILFVAQAGSDFETAHLDFAQQLLEPFCAALENDRRLQELNALRPKPTGARCSRGWVAKK
jgi:hypothetical protein